MLTYELGKPFPHSEQSLPGCDTARIMTTSTFFDLLIYSLTPETDRTLVTKLPLQYGLFEQDNIPFFLIDFAGELVFDAALNVNRIHNQNIDAWLKSNYCTVTIFLIDARTNILYGFRHITIRMEVAKLLRSICRKQDSIYPGIGSVDEVIDKITNALTTADMLKRTLMYSFPPVDMP